MFSTPFRLYFLHCLLALGLLAANTWTSEARAQTAGAVQETTLRAHTVGDQLIRYLEAWANAQSGEAQQQQARQIANAVAQSVRQHPEFLAARAALTSSREGVDEARAAWWPQLSGNTGFGNRTTGGVSINTPTYGVTLSQLLFDFGNTSAKIGAAELRVQGAQAGLDKKQAAVVMRAVSAWHELYRTRKLMELHRLNVQARQDIVAFIKERADLGGSAASDVLRARARQTEAEAALSAASVREQAAESAWREVFQSEPPSKVEVWPDFALNVGALKEQVDALVARFPTVQEAKQLSLASEKDAAAARANLFPRVALEHSIAQNKQTSSGTEYTDRSTLVTLRYNFLSGGAEMARARQAASKAVEYAMQAETEQRNTEKNLRQTLSEVALGQEILRNRRLAVGVANDTLAAVREQFAFRRGSLLDLLRAQEDVFMAGRDLIDAVTDHALARYRLLYMASMLEEHFSLGTPP